MLTIRVVCAMTIEGVAYDRGDLVVPASLGHRLVDSYPMCFRYKPEDEANDKSVEAPPVDKMIRSSANKAGAAKK